MILKTKDKRTIVDFRGDIIVACSNNKNVTKIVFGQIPKRYQKFPAVAGESYPELDGLKSTDFINPIEFVFNNEVSIDVIIGALQEARKQLIEKSKL